MRSTILDSDYFGDRSQTSIVLWMLGARIPNLFQLVSDNVHRLTNSDTIPAHDIVQKLLSDLDNWRGHWLSLLEDTCEDVFEDGTKRHQALMLLLVFYMLTLITNRLRVAVDPKEATKMENQALMASASIFRLRNAFMSCRFDVRNNGSIPAKIADATQQTAVSWKEQIAAARYGKSIQAAAFDEWCSLIGRAPEEQS